MGKTNGQLVDILEQVCAEIGATEKEEREIEDLLYSDPEEFAVRYEAFLSEQDISFLGGNVPR